MPRVYDSILWADARVAALRRDDHRCTVSRLLGGDCGDHLHVHHIVPVDDGGAAYDLDNLATACDRHHPKWEALRRTLTGSRAKDADVREIRCRHQHRSIEARLICEARLSRQRRSRSAA